MNLLRFIKAALIFARHQAWVNEPKWEPSDAKALEQFLTSPAGQKLRAFLLNAVLKQQAIALSESKAGNLAFEAGYCNGQKGIISVIEALSDAKSFSEQGDTDSDPATHQAES